MHVYVFVFVCLCVYLPSFLPPPLPPDLKDDNVQLRERNQALVGYIDTLLLSIIEKKPDILEVKPFQPTATSNNTSSVTV